MIVYLNSPCGSGAEVLEETKLHPVDVPIACTVGEMLSFCRINKDGGIEITVNGAPSTEDKVLVDGDVVEIAPEA